ncbi:hypothetical protein [Paenibacillus puerhi]|uniref:hypothetical protein n=1 Tax=Paenibacillus puerhi TaxID=2692622 RepID=UPI001359DC8E|nr:hypothetical protein [Paenibacillus puerhi]
MFPNKVLSWLLLSLCFLLASPGLNVKAAGAAAEQPSSQVLVIYDSLSIGTPTEGNVEALQRLLASFGTQVTLSSFDKYEPGALQRYDHVIAVRNAGDLTELPGAYVRDFEAYQGRYLHIGAHLPQQAVQALELQEERGTRDRFRLAIGQLSEASLPVENLPSIVRYAGKGYGNWSSGSRSGTTPYGILNGRHAYVPYMQKGNLSELGIAYLLADWLEVRAPSGYYAVFKEIYPFSDLQLLRRLADRLYESGIPFVASVRPILDNFDYPAAQRYLETLKYVQSRNGSLVVDAPFVASTISQDITTLNKELASFVDALADYGIAPLGIGAEMYWSYDEHYASKGLAFFDSVVMFPNERIMHRAPTSTSKTFASTLYTLKAGELERFDQSIKAIEPLPMNTAFVFELPEGEEQLEATIQALQGDWKTFSDYKSMVHVVRTDKHEIRSAAGLLQINGRTLVLNKDFAQIESDHTYIEEGERSFDALFTIQNNIFIVLITTTLLIFGIFLVIGYRLYKRKYTHPGRKL